MFEADSGALVEGGRVSQSCGVFNGFRSPLSSIPFLTASSTFSSTPPAPYRLHRHVLRSPRLIRIRLAEHLARANDKGPPCIRVELNPLEFDPTDSGGSLMITVLGTIRIFAMLHRMFSCCMPSFELWSNSGISTPRSSFRTMGVRPPKEAM